MYVKINGCMCTVCIYSIDGKGDKVPNWMVSVVNPISGTDHHKCSDRGCGAGSGAALLPGLGGGQFGQPRMFKWLYF